MDAILLACLLTVAIETPFLVLCGYRGRRAVGVIVCANVLTNLPLNLAFALGLPYRPGVIAAAELAVVAIEYLIYAKAFGRSRKLLLLTLVANCLSFGLGLLIFGG